MPFPFCAPTEGRFYFILFVKNNTRKDFFKMKKSIVSTVSIILSIVCVLCLVSCNETVDKEGIWENATYLSDTTLGKGEKSVSFTVEAEDQSITITLKTDKNTLGEAMYEHDLINDPTFFDTLNGMQASWEKDQAYWAFYHGEDLMMVGVGDTTIEGGEAYRFVYTK